MKTVNCNTTFEDIEDALDKVEEANVTTVEDVIEALGPASFLPILLLVSLVVVTPLSSIPGLSGMSGIVIALIAGQLILGREKLWLPDLILSRKVPGDRLNKALAQIRPPLSWMQDHTKERLPFLVRGRAIRVLLVLCMLCGLVMPFLEVLPATSSMMAGAIAILCLSLISRDGVLAIAGLISVGLVLVVLSVLFKAAFSLL
ncbi:exopolysaccharide biosynthesis protein [Yoonia sp. BS5-3]|uniref:Exopolysaccharide biosynthesis protein n=1 Tax=Yoonia phaeophyticola TaxID=3137369 RepID=A0ABZ2V063_9RHOB